MARNDRTARTRSQRAPIRIFGGTGAVLSGGGWARAVDLIRLFRWLLILNWSDVEARENLAANNIRPGRSQH